MGKVKELHVVFEEINRNYINGNHKEMAELMCRNIADVPFLIDWLEDEYGRGRALSLIRKFFIRVDHDNLALL